MHDLFAAYIKYASSLNLKSEILDSDIGRVSAKICGEGVIKAFENEAGKHVVQRVPPTETNGRVQTSVVVVAVLPLKTQNKINPLNPNDLTITTMRGTGPGGQHKNRTESCVKIVHNPTGLQAIVDKRDQTTSKREALEILTERVNQHINAEKDSAYNSKRKDQLGNSGRGDKVRTYNFIDSRVTDHRTNKKTNQIKKIMKGQFNLIK